MDGQTSGATRYNGQFWARAQRDCHSTEGETWHGWNSRHTGTWRYSGEIEVDAMLHLCIDSWPVGSYLCSRLFRSSLFCDQRLNGYHHFFLWSSAISSVQISSLGGLASVSGLQLLFPHSPHRGILSAILQQPDVSDGTPNTLVWPEETFHIETASLRIYVSATSKHIALWLSTI